MFKRIYVLYLIGLYAASIHRCTSTEWSSKVDVYFRKITDV